MRLIALHCGDIHGDEGFLHSGEVSRVTVTIPIMSFAVEHEAGTVVWDTGMHPLVRTDPVGYWGRVAVRVLVPDLPEDADLPSRLRQASIDPDAVRLVVNSHLHNDHAGMNRFFPKAKVLIRRREWEYAMERMDEPSGFIRNDFYGGDQPEANIELFDYEDSHDLFGDGSVKLLSTTGHTPGHQSLLVTFPSGRSFALSGDAMYRAASLEDHRLPGVVWDPALALAAIHRLAGLHRAGTTVLVQHDAATWEDRPPVEILHVE